jgi:hypothetical protein
MAREISGKFERNNLAIAISRIAQISQIIIIN